MSKSIPAVALYGSPFVAVQLGSKGPEREEIGERKRIFVPDLKAVVVKLIGLRWHIRFRVCRWVLGFGISLIVSFQSIRVRHKVVVVLDGALTSCGLLPLLFPPFL